MHSNLISPHGDKLINLVVDEKRAEELKDLSRDWPSWDLTPRQICDLELLANGGFSPLEGFLCRNDYESVCEKMRLVDGTIWPIPIMLDITEELAKNLAEGSILALRDAEGVMLAALNVEQIWQSDLMHEARKVFGTTNPEHPGVKYLQHSTNPWYAGGKLEVLQLPHHYDFVEFRLTPAQLREKFTTFGWHSA
ncbi:MAG: adenylyltransferase, partial [Planctomycetota bacterium]